MKILTASIKRKGPACKIACRPIRHHHYIGKVSKLVVLMAGFVLILAHVCIADQQTIMNGDTVALVFDTSPTSHGTELRQAAVNFYRSSSIGERVLLFVVRGSDTQMVFACTKTADDREFADFVAIVNGIKIDWLAHAKLANALSGPVYQQVSQHCSQNEHAIIVVITTGNFSDGQARDICKFGSNIKHNHKWSLLTTGLVDETPRQIFLTATAGELCWYNLADAVHSTMVEKWLKDVRRDFEDTLHKQMNQTVLLNSAGSRKDTYQTETLKTIAKEPNIVNVTVGTEPNKPQPKNEDANKTAQAKSPYVKKIPIEQTIPSVFSPPSDANDKKQSVVLKPADVVKDANGKTNSTYGVKSKVNSLKVSMTRLKRFTMLLLTAVGVFIAAAMITVLYRSWAKAKGWKKRVEKPLSDIAGSKKSKDAVLMAQIGEALYRLGNLRCFRRVYIGNSAKNAIRIDRKGIIDRHLKIYRRFSSLRMKNLSKKSVMVNGHKLESGKKINLLLPAEITACEGVVIRLFVSKPDVIKTAQLQEAADGTRK